MHFILKMCITYIKKCAYCFVFVDFIYICNVCGQRVSSPRIRINPKNERIMAICPCPAGASLPNVPNASCAVDFGQVQKIVLQRIFSSGTTKNGFSTSAAIGTLASWTANFAATDGTKMVITPYVENPTSDGGDPITYGGGNDTLGGETKITGRNPVNMTFAMRQIPQAIAKALKSLSCEELGVYLINGDGQILAVAGSTSGTYSPIPIRNLFVGDLKLNGLETPDENALQFSFTPNWSDNVEVVTPSFNPLTDLTNATA